MTSMKVDEIRDRFLRFFEERGHRIYQSDSLVPVNDPTLLFTGAGMNQFKEEFLGKVKDSRRAATCQKCLRTGDLERVGKTPDHHTFFEMLGNFSFGDYFKKDAIIWAWEFLIKELGLKEEDLWVSVYKGDNEAYDIWKNNIKIPSSKIMKLGEKENFWPSNAPTQGPNGPCGPCSEIFFGGEDGVEVWNLVFTQFDRKDSGKLDPLPSKNIDTGMGIERIARVLQGKKTNFEIDSFAPIINTIREISLKKSEKDSTINAIADHIRAVSFAVCDGVLPSNEERGYVIRKLIRKAFWYGRALGLEEPFLYKLVPVVAKAMKNPYPELTQRREDIAQVVLSEEERFRNTIHDGLERLESMIKDSKGVLTGENAFKLYDTYGFPLELTQEIASERGISIGLDEFNKCIQEQRVKSRKSSKIVSDSIFTKDLLEIKITEHKTPFIEDKEEITTKVLLKEKDSVFLEKTNFYGEKGGQVGDTGWLIKDRRVVADIIDAIDIAGRVQHKIKITKGELKEGDEVVARIDSTRRENIRKNHTATHLLHNALRKVLGEHVKQAGSLVAPDRLRFDFNHFKALTGEEIARVEELVNKYIGEKSPIEAKNTSFNDAKASGAIALFGEKYGDEVRVVNIGDYSKELCGGTHVKNTKEIKRFRIISESSIASGVRRIEALTGDLAEKQIDEEKKLIKDIAEGLKTAPENILSKIEELTQRIKKLERALEDFSVSNLGSRLEGLLQKTKNIKGRDVIISEIENLDMELLRKTADIIRAKNKNSIFVLLSEKDGRVFMVVGAGGQLNAVKILNDIGSGFGIKGGGRPDFAQAGGPTGVNISLILKKAEEVIKNILLGAR